MRSADAGMGPCLHAQSNSHPMMAQLSNLCVSQFQVSVDMIGQESLENINDCSLGASRYLSFICCCCTNPPGVLLAGTCRLSLSDVCSSNKDVPTCNSFGSQGSGGATQVSGSE